MWQVVLLCLALCTDTFVASICYGAGGIHIDWKRVGIMNGIGCLCLGAALCFGTAVYSLVPGELADGICFTSMLFLGLIRLSDSLIKNYINHHCEIHKDIHFSFSGLRFILSIYGDPVAADSDRNRTLSFKETACLGLAMSIDSLAAGTFAAFLKIPVAWTLVSVFAFGCMAMAAGEWTGYRLARKLRWDISWISGVFFLLLAFGRL